MEQRPDRSHLSLVTSDHGSSVNVGEPSPLLKRTRPKVDALKLNIVYEIFILLLKRIEPVAYLDLIVRRRGAWEHAAGRWKIATVGVAGR